MKTDSLLYELFQFDPQSLIHLLKLKLEGQYAFESITIKTTEKRLDGFFKRIDGDGPHLFLEAQGYDDPKIFWRLFRKICTFYEQRDDRKPFIAIALFLDEKYDPGPFVLSCIAPCQFFRVNLIDCLKALESAPGTLTVLKPLVLTSKQELVEALPQWKDDIRSLNLPEAKHKRLVELLEYAIVQRFPELTEEEVDTMLHLTPIEQTTVGKQIFGRGLDKGELIGNIKFAQRLLKQPLSSKEELAKKTEEELKSILQQLEAELESSLRIQ
ncbi:Rpn family recombination-promoting nuclease/putative transposase [candidate division KSB1 bacterium]|nr:Rpn family recombination-promoting nuclease/putative transposase [candidate division KSB1 bacterium]